MEKWRPGDKGVRIMEGLLYYNIPMYIHYIHTYKYIMQDNLTQFYTNLHYNVILHLFAK